MKSLTVTPEKKPSPTSVNQTDNFNSTSDLDKQLLTKHPEATQLRDMKQIPETPFTAVKIGDQWILTMGKYKLAGPFETYDQAEEETKDVSWNRILEVMTIVATDLIAEQMKESYTSIQTLKTYAEKLDQLTKTN